MSLLFTIFIDPPVWKLVKVGMKTKRTYGRVYYVEKKLLVFYAFDLQKRQNDSKKARRLSSLGYREANVGKPLNLGLLRLTTAGLAGGFLPSIGLTCYPTSTPFSLPSSLQAAARPHAARRSSTRISWALPIIPDGRFRSCLVPVPNLLPGLCAKITKEIHDGSA